MIAGKFRLLQDQYSEPLLTALTIMLAVLLFVVGPLQAAGVAQHITLALHLGVLVAAVFVLSGSMVAFAAILVRSL